MAILRLKNEKGEWIEIPALVGPRGEKGSDASVTSENIKTALGYEPAQQTDVEKLSEDIADLKENGNGSGATAEQIKQIETNRINICEFAKPNDTHVNLNDEVYKYGFFTQNGDYLENYNYGFVTENYLSVIGGRTLEAYCTQKLSSGYLCVVEYDYKRKFIQRQNLYPRDITDGTPKSITLSNNTKYIRLCIPATTDIKDIIELSVFYSENAKNEYVPYDETPEGSLVDYSRILNVETDSVKIFSNLEAMQHSADLKEGTVCETLGYHSENDGGSAKYLITALANTVSYQEALRNGLYATLIHDGTINVKQLGAYGDNSNDDTSAFQKAFDFATVCVYIPEGKYKITSTVLVSSKERFTVNAENSYIVYRGTTGYCFKVVKSWHCTFNFGYVLASGASAGCLEFYSANANEGEAYFNIHFRNFRSDSNCVYIHADNDGYVNEFRFYDGQVTGYSNSDANVGFRIESHGLETVMDRYSFHCVGIEGVHTGFHLIGREDVIWNSTNGHPQVINIVDCRTCETFVKLIKTENTVRRINIDTAVVLNTDFFDFSEKTDYSVIYAHFLNEYRGKEVATTTYVHNGKFIPFVKERTLYHVSTPEIDLTQKNDADSVFTMMNVTEWNTMLKLSDVYGMEHGVNKFKVNMLGKNTNGFVIYDSKGNVICDGTSLNVGDIVEFEWFTNELLGSYWVATKMNTIPLTAN